MGFFAYRCEACPYKFIKLVAHICLSAFYLLYFYFVYALFLLSKGYVSFKNIKETENTNI